MSYQDLDKLLGLIGQSVKQALEAVDSYSVKSFLDYFEVPPEVDMPSFDATELPHVKPKTVSVPIPNSNGEYESKDIPLVALINHSSLALEDVRIRFRVALDTTSTTEDEGEGEGPRLRAELGPSSIKRPPTPEPPPSRSSMDMSFPRGEQGESPPEQSGEEDPMNMSFAGPGGRGAEGEGGDAHRPPSPQEPPSFAEVEVHFKRGEPPEGVSRIVRQYYKHI